MVRPPLAPHARAVAPWRCDRPPDRVVDAGERQSPRLAPSRRRQLTPGQLAMVALKVKPLLEEEARERSLANLNRGTKSPTGSLAPIGKANDLAGARVGVSGMSVKRAARVVRDERQERRGEG